MRYRIMNIISDFEPSPQQAEEGGEGGEAAGGFGQRIRHGDAWGHSYISICTNKQGICTHTKWVGAHSRQNLKTVGAPRHKNERHA